MDRARASGVHAGVSGDAWVAAPTTWTFDPDPANLLRMKTETIAGSLYNKVVTRKFEDAGNETVAGRDIGLQIGVAGNPAQDCGVTYAYEPKTTGAGRLAWIGCPGLPAYGVTYACPTISDAVEYVRYMSGTNVEADTLARVTWSYPWSSAAAHTGGADASGLLNVEAWRRSWRPAGWQTQLRRPQDEEEVLRLRLSTHTGRPLASDTFLSKLERKVGRRLRPSPVGRPRTTDLHAWLLKWIAEDELPDRPDRSEPRRKKRRPKEYSLLRKARSWYHLHRDTDAR